MCCECRAAVRANIELAPNLIVSNLNRLRSGVPSIANEMVPKWSSLFRFEPYLNCLGPAEHANT
jgi:hypothetical protein